MPAQSTYVPIQTWASTGSSNGYTFTAIPQTYTDLVVVTYGRDTRAVQDEVVLIAINGDTSSLYSYTYTAANGSSVNSYRATAQGFAINFTCLTGASAPTNVFGSGSFTILNYANSTTFKTILGSGAADTNGNGLTSVTTGIYRNTSPVTSLLVQTYNPLLTGSTITLYGIAAA